MKKILTIILLSGFVINSQGQLLNTNCHWIATESNQIKKKGWISPIDGIIVKFDKEQLIMSHVFYDSVRCYQLEIKKEKIYLNDTLWGKIKYLDNDSLLVDFSKRMRVKFLPIEKGNYGETGIDFWNSTNWTFFYNEYSQELKLLDSLWGFYPKETAKICVTQSKDIRYKYSETEKWNIKEIDGRHIFVKKFCQFEYEIYNVLEYKNDTVVLECLSYNDSAQILLIKEPLASVSERDKIIDILQNQRWYSAKLINMVNSFEEDSIDSEVESTGYFVIDTTLFKRTSLLNNQLSFEFSDNSEYKIFESDTLRISGKWRLSETGKQIVLDSGFNPNNYIDLFKVETDSVIIGKSDMFYIGKRKKEYINYYYKMILTK